MNKKDFIEFCEILLELLEAHITLDQALAMISKSKQTKPKLRNFAKYILQEIGQGAKFSRVLESNVYFTIPSHYITLFSSEENTGTIDKTLLYIKNSEKRKKEALENIVRASIYPLIIVILVSVGTYLLFKMQDFFIYGEAKLSFSSGHVGAVIFLFLSMLAFFVAVLLAFFDTKQLRFFYICIFYLESGFDSFQALENSVLQFPLGSKIRHNLIQSISSIEGGKNISEAFSSTNFFDSFFLMQLEYGLEIGNILTAVKTAYKKELNKIKKRQNYLLSICEPYMIVCVGIYLAVMVQLTVIPLLTSFGGVI